MNKQNIINDFFKIVLQDNKNISEKQKDFKKINLVYDIIKADDSLIEFLFPLIQKDTEEENNKIIFNLLSLKYRSYFVELASEKFISFLKKHPTITKDKQWKDFSNKNDPLFFKNWVEMTKQHNPFLFSQFTISEIIDVLSRKNITTNYEGVNLFLDYILESQDKKTYNLTLYKILQKKSPVLFVKTIKKLKINIFKLFNNEHSFLNDCLNEPLIVNLITEKLISAKENSKNNFIQKYKKQYSTEETYPNLSFLFSTFNDNKFNIELLKEKIYLESVMFNTNIDDFISGIKEELKNKKITFRYFSMESYDEKIKFLSTKDDSIVNQIITTINLLDLNKSISEEKKNKKIRI